MYANDGHSGELFQSRMRRIGLAALVLILMVGSASAGPHKTFVQDLYSRYAYRPATAGELEYWSDQISKLAPEQAERKLRCWFFCHAAYKTTLGWDVTIFDIKDMVESVDAGHLGFRDVQQMLFTCEAYGVAKRTGRAGTMMVPLRRTASGPGQPSDLRLGTAD